MKKLLRNKYIILVPIFILNVISIIYLSSTSYIDKQLLFLFISYILLFITSKLNVKFLLKFISIFYIFSVLLLTFVLFFGKEINGSRAWIKIFGFSIQPSEIAKLVLSIYLPYLVLKNKKILFLIIITLIPTILTFLEPDTGAVIFYFIILLSTLKYLKLNRKLFISALVIVVVFIIGNVSLYVLNKDFIIDIYGTDIFYRIDRLVSFKNQDNIQISNSLISIGSHNLLYIPESHNDFIFAAVISKYPVLFVPILFSFILIFIYYLKNISHKKNISNIINFIILNTLLIQSFYNILMNLSLLPIIGIPLPFISYGGSYLVTLYVLIGLSINLNSNSSMVV